MIFVFDSEPILTEKQLRNADKVIVITNTPRRGNTPMEYDVHKRIYAAGFLFSWPWVRVQDRINAGLIQTLPIEITV